MWFRIKQTGVIDDATDFCMTPRGFVGITRSHERIIPVEVREILPKRRKK